MSVLEQTITATAATTASEPKRVPIGTWRTVVAAGDAVAAVASALIALESRFGGTTSKIAGLGNLTYSTLLVLTPLAWLSVVALVGGYRARPALAAGDDVRPIATATLWLLALFGISELAWHADLSRNVVAATVVFTPLLTVGLRLVARRALGLLLQRGWTLRNALVVGDSAHLDDFLEYVSRVPKTGLHVAGSVCHAELDDRDISAELIRRAHDVGADTLIVMGSHRFGTDTLRRIAWSLETADIHLIVAPALMHFAGPRVSVESIAGLPLLGIDAPTFSGPRRILKDWADRALAGALGLIALPFLAFIAGAVWLNDREFPLYVQTRVGKNGRLFKMVKFRTMHSSAERELCELNGLNESTGPLFKIRGDPRVTRVGRWLRRYSLDELPQLWNVVWGEMSLVGPRPALPSEVAAYEEDVRRRLLVKPGITGLWQVSGRADLHWHESVRLDLYYVDNWSLSLDLILLLRTAGAVLTARGAY